MTVRGNFYITLKALEDFARLECIDLDNDREFDRAEAKLIDRMSRAHFSRLQSNGLELWRLGTDRGAPRYRVLVSTKRNKNGALPQVVAVLPEHA